MNFSKMKKISLLLICFLFLPFCVHADKIKGFVRVFDKRTRMVTLYMFKGEVEPHITSQPVEEKKIVGIQFSTKGNGHIQTRTPSKFSSVNSLIAPSIKCKEIDRNLSFYAKIKDATEGPLFVLSDANRVKFTSSGNFNINQETTINLQLFANGIYVRWYVGNVIFKKFDNCRKFNHCEICP